MRRPRPRGFALLSVLWIMTGVAVLGLGLSLTARGAIATSRNRIELTRAEWLAEECIARVRTAAALALKGNGPGTVQSDTAWQNLEDLAHSALVGECVGTVTMRPVGLALNINDASEDAVRRLLLRQGAHPLSVDSLVDAVLDWRDADDQPRGLGAEREWYEHEGRSPPRNRPLAHVDEVVRIRGFDRWHAVAARDSLSALFTTEPGRIVLERAPASVLASLPGLTEESVARLIERRLRGAPGLGDPSMLASELSVASRDTLRRYYADLVQLATLEPDAWLLTVRSPGSIVRGAAGPQVVLEARVVRSGSRAVIVRRRAWP